MTRSTLLPVFIVLLALLFYGCTRVENPTRDTSEGVVAPTEPLTVFPDRNETLDTQPVAVEARGGRGEILWSTAPPYEHSVLPETGRRVLFSPPDLAHDGKITLIAADETRNTARAEISVADQGGPPLPGEVLINEIGWAGTLMSASDEYIELVNRSARALYLDGWTIENGAGSGVSLVFSTRIEAGSPLLVANYGTGSEKSAVLARVDCADSKLSISNDAFGPFILKDRGGTVFDRVGDGEKYPHGLNTKEVKSSMARYTHSSSQVWDPASWYTEGASLNLRDSTLGTPGARNSDLPYSTGGGGGAGSLDSTRAIISEYFIDAHDGVGEDWAEFYVTKGGSVKTFVLTDLDGDDSPITGGSEISVEEGETILVVWADAPGQTGATYFIADSNPTGTKDELVLLCGGSFLDGVCYSADGLPPDDFATLQEFGWKGDPVRSKHAARVTDESGTYSAVLGAEAWTSTAQPTPGERNAP